MRLLRSSILLVVLLAVAVPAARAAAPAGTRTRLVYVGPGVADTAQRQVVRSRDGFVYIASVDDDAYSGGAYADLHMYRGNHAGVPTAFTSVDAGHDPHVRNPLDISGGDARIDAGGTIHVVYAVSNLSNNAAAGYAENSMTVRYQTFATGSGRWGPAQTVTRLPADGDGVRGRVVTALALDRAGRQLVVTASSAGVSAWTPAGGGRWARHAIAGAAGLHPSLAFDASGHAHLAWLSSPYGSAAIHYAVRAPG